MLKCAKFDEYEICTDSIITFFCVFPVKQTVYISYSYGAAYSQKVTQIHKILYCNYNHTCYCIIYIFKFCYFFLYVRC